MPLAVKTTIELEEKDSLRECVKEHNACSNRVQKWGRPKSATHRAYIPASVHIYTSRFCPLLADLAELSDWNSSNRCQ